MNRVKSPALAPDKSTGLHHCTTPTDQPSNANLNWRPTNRPQHVHDRNLVHRIPCGVKRVDIKFQTVPVPQLRGRVPLPSEPELAMTLLQQGL